MREIAFTVPGETDADDQLHVFVGFARPGDDLPREYVALGTTVPKTVPDTAVVVSDRTRSMGGGQ